MQQPRCKTLQATYIGSLYLYIHKYIYILFILGNMNTNTKFDVWKVMRGCMNIMSSGFEEYHIFIKGYTSSNINSVYMEDKYDDRVVFRYVKDDVVYRCIDCDCGCNSNKRVQIQVPTDIIPYVQECETSMEFIDHTADDNTFWMDIYKNDKQFKCLYYLHEDDKAFTRLDVSKDTYVNMEFALLMKYDIIDYKITLCATVASV